MKLTRKLVAALMVGVVAVLATHAAVRVHREIALFEADTQRDDISFGRTLARMAAQLSEQVGPAKALELVEQANSNGQAARIRWVWLDAPANDPRRAQVPAEQLGGLADAKQITVRLPRDQGGFDLYTYAAVETEGDRRIAIELVESLAEEARYLREAILDIILETVAIVVVCGALAIWLGVLMVGRPVRRIIELARRIGRGDLAGRLTLSQRDELGELAEGMNLMCVQLAEASEKVEAETAARFDAIESLRHADRLTTVGKLASGVAHELGTPLNVISGRAHLIVTEYDDKSVAHQNATIIGTQSRRMAAIVRQLLDFARRSQGRTDRRDLRAIAAQTVQMLAPQAQKHGVNLVFEGRETALADVKEGQLQQAINNLIMNGIDATPTGGTITVTVGGAEVERPPRKQGDPTIACLRLSVKDEGTGIRADDLPHIFEPFFTTKEVGKGTGLGLSVTHGIIQDQGGWIEVDSEVGRGSCFSIFLPRATTA
jgi:two-component system NtrC family sensor kinase